MIGSARIAWAFLTRLPGGVHPDSSAAVAASVPWFPVVGVVLGATTGAVFLGLSEILSPVLAGIAAVGLGALVTGAFHEDGLADTFDSFGGYTVERRLEIMRDSRIGTFGTLALVLATGAKVAALAPLSGVDGLAALVAAHGLARAGALGVMLAGPEARPDGLGAASADLPRRAVGAVIVAGTTVGMIAGPPTALAVVLVAVAAAGLIWTARRRFGGVTGDVLGAGEQIGEVLVLVAVGATVHDTGWLWT